MCVMGMLRCWSSSIINFLNACTARVSCFVLSGIGEISNFCQKRIISHLISLQLKCSWVPHLACSKWWMGESLLESEQDKEVYIVWRANYQHWTSTSALEPKMVFWGKNMTTWRWMTRAFHCDDLDTPHDYIQTKSISDPNLAPKRDILGQKWPF